MFPRLLCFFTILLAVLGPPVDDPMDPIKFSPLPAVFSLYNTFSSSSFGINFSDETFDEENDETSQVLTVLENWTSTLQSDLAKARAFQNPMAASLYLDNSVKYVVLPKSDFQSALKECALNHKGYLPFDISQLQSAINFESIYSSFIQNYVSF